MRTIVHNASVFDGLTPHLLENHFVVVEDGRIVELAAGSPAMAAERMIDAGGRTLLPGLIDLHTHACLNDVTATRAVAERTEIVALYAAQALRRSLMSGFTTLRDAGGMDPIYGKAATMGLLEAPRLYPAGRFITMTGGHGDMRDPALQPFMSCCGGHLQDRFICIADGPDEVRKAVREELRRGATQIKLFVSGGVLSPTGQLHHLEFTEEEIRAAVETATAQFRYVLAHCHPDSAIRRAAACGVRSIEHCSFITEDTANYMVEVGAYAVPTMAIAKGLHQQAQALNIPPASRDKMAGVWEPMLRSMEILRRAKVKIGLGTDVIGQLAPLQCSEFTLRAEIFSSYEILVSATSMAAEIMMETGNLGVIAPGAHADLILVDDDPLADVRVLDRGGRNVSLVMKAGVIHKTLL